MKEMLAGKKIFVLDASVLMHDPGAIFRFQEHSVFLPLIVLEELKHVKQKTTEITQNIRQFNHFLDELVSTVDPGKLNEGIQLNQHTIASHLDRRCKGTLFFQSEPLTSQLPDLLPQGGSGNAILETVLALQSQYDACQIILVSRDISLRIKASILGITAEDYHNAKALEDIDLLYSGHLLLSTDFWNSNSAFNSWEEAGKTYYQIESEQVINWHPNQFVVSSHEPEFQARVMSVDKGVAVLVQLDDFQTQQTWGIQALNCHQNFALNMLLNPEIDFVTLLGNAGTGKTLLALAAGLQMTMEENRYHEIIMTRETIAVGEDIGYLPGTEEEKMAPWMGALMDNLELLGNTTQQSGWKKTSTEDFLMSRIKLRSINYMRGRTFQNRYIILDEAQNLTVKQIKTLITRAGPGTKLVCLGNLAQIDTSYLSATSSGLTFAVDRFKHWEHSAHITLLRGERSRLADFASENL
ncbi:MAG TPA: PhoH family protein [Crenotrichaceae bacterium]|nr:PhoH family protein [Crenotrichaceae bacterium]